MNELRREKLELLAWVLAWPVVHVGNYVLPRPFFEHVLLGLSVYAIIITQRDKVKTTEAKIAAEKE